MPIPRLDTEATALLVVDMQERLMAVMEDRTRLVEQTTRLVRGARALGLPMVVTEQYPEALGSTVSELAEALGEAVGVYDKLKFSACIEPVRAALSQRGIRSVLVAGIEAHVCVQQTCFDLMDAGYVVGVVYDAIGSRRALDREVARWRMMQAGVIPLTVESALLELVREAGGEKFGAILPIIK